MLLTGAQFLGSGEARPIELRWDSEESPVVATGVGPAFALAVTIPSDVGLHYLIATQRLRSNGPQDLLQPNWPSDREAVA